MPRRGKRGQSPPHSHVGDGQPYMSGAKRRRNFLGFFDCHTVIRMVYYSTSEGHGIYGAPFRALGLFVRAAWCCCNLNNNGNAGLPARNSNNTVTNTNWNGSVGCPSGCLSSSASSCSASYIPRVLRKLLETSTSWDGLASGGEYLGAAGAGTRWRLVA